MTTSAPKDDEITVTIRHHWDGRAATFDDEPGHGLHSRDQREAWLEILRSLSGRTPQRVLDVGCGTGFLALLLSELGHSVTGIDLASKMLKVAHQKAQQAHLNVEFRLENAASVRDPDCSYDLVIARHVIWLLPDPARGVQEWSRVLRPGGRLALIEGKWASDEIRTKNTDSVKRAIAAMIRAGSRVIPDYFRKWRQWAFVLGKAHNWRYRQIQAQLPFAGGPAADRLVEFLEAQGLRDLTIEELTRPILWGGGPQYSRYLVVGRRE